MDRTVGPFFCTIQSDGTGVMSAGPTGNLWWDVERIASSGNSTLNPNLVVTYQGMTIGSTYTANNDVDSDPKQSVAPGQSLVFNYSKGSPGAIMRIDMKVNEHF